jgi:hypothetical protein
MRSRVRALVDRLMPWYDAAVEARVHHDVKRTIAASTAARHRAERAIEHTESDRVRRAYQAYADGFRR